MQHGADHPHSSEENSVRTAERRHHQMMYEAFGRGDVQNIVGQLTDDVRWTSYLDPIVPWSGDFSGKQNVPRFFQAINDNAETTAFTPKEFVAQGDTVASTGERLRSQGDRQVDARPVGLCLEVPERQSLQLRAVPGPCPRRHLPQVAARRHAMPIAGGGVPASIASVRFVITPLCSGWGRM